MELRTLITALFCATLVPACSTPACPPNMIQHGMTCSHCPEGSEKKGNRCVSLDGGVTVEPVTADEDADVEEDVDASADMSTDPGTGLDANNSANDASSFDAGGGPAMREFALGTAGSACTSELEQSLACEGHASRKILKCQGGTWQVLQTCGPSERCDSRVGTEQGTCAAIPAACAGKSPGDICDGLVRLECGIDLVSVTNRACSEHSHCEGSPSARCACDTGFQDDGQSGCKNPDDCPAGACSGGKCVDGLGDYSCNCDSGYAGTGTKKCTPVLYCPKDACTPGGTCNDTMNWSCQCNTGFAGTGTQACTNQNDCPSNRCLPPNGTCQDQVGTYDCKCNAGFSGGDCVNDICSPNPCKNGGTCARTGTLCTCVAGYSGTNCEVDSCNPNPCQHGGVCTRTSSMPSCNCNGTGYQGNQCETKVDPCNGTSNACGGSCMTPLAHQPNESCNNGLQGACARTGKYVCQGTATTVCSAPSATGGAEICGDNIDNDCDGSSDDDDATNATIWYRDCDGDGYSPLTQSAITAGTGVRRACSKPLPESGCTGGWTAKKPQSPLVNFLPIDWDCDDSSRPYNPAAAFGIPPEGKTSTDLNCNSIEEKEDAVGLPVMLVGGFSSVPRCPASLSCTECAINVDGSPRNGAQWLDSSFNPTDTQPPCSRSGSDTHVVRTAVEIVGGVCTGSGNWGTTFVNAAQKCR